MQIESKELYNIVAKKESLDPYLVKSIGDVVFKKMNRLTSDPPNLVLNLRGLGRRFIRRKKTLDLIAGLKYIIKEIEEGKRNRLPKEVLIKDLEFMENLMKRYERYMEKKKEYKKIRYASDSSLEPTVQQREIQETGSDNIGECERVPAGEPKVIYLKD